jgi:hypothetical protein
MGYKRDSKKKAGRKKLAKAFKKDPTLLDPHKGKKTVLVPHPDLPRTFIEKVVE